MVVVVVVVVIEFVVVEAVFGVVVVVVVVVGARTRTFSEIMIQSLFLQTLTRAFGTDASTIIPISASGRSWPSPLNNLP